MALVQRCYGGGAGEGAAGFTRRWHRASSPSTAAQALCAEVEKLPRCALTMEGAGGEAPRSAPPTNWRSFHPTIFRFRRTVPSALRTPRVMTLDEDSSAAGGGSSAAHGAQPRPPQQPPSALQLQSAQEVRSPPARADPPEHGSGTGCCTRFEEGRGRHAVSSRGARLEDAAVVRLKVELN